MLPAHNHLPGPPALLPVVPFSVFLQINGHVYVANLQTLFLLWLKGMNPLGLFADIW